MSGHDDLVRLSAVEAVAALKAGEVSPLELVDAAAERIEAVDDAVNALPIRCFERAREHAKALMDGRRREQADHPAWLAGLPIAIKDLMDVEGVRSTFGCPVFADNVATSSDVLVRTLEARGAIVIAKSNTPEFGMLPVTENRVFGVTRSPFDTRMTAGGSSGGAAAAVATGEVWLAHGSDIGGSLRIPAACCGVVGHRPSPGRVPRNPSKRAFSPMGVQGPMARNVADAALFLDAQTAWSAADPLSLEETPGRFARAVAEARPPKRVAFTADFGLGGCDPEAEAIARRAADALAGMGVTVEEAHPEMGDVARLYMDLIAINVLTERAAFADAHRDRIEPVLATVVENGRRLTAERIAAVQRERAALFDRFAAMFATYDLILSPTLGTPPFPVERHWSNEVQGWAGTAPPAWFRQCWATVPIACPATSILAGFTSAGLPIGLQFLAPVRRDDLALAGAALVEQALGLATELPIEPRMGG